MWFVQINSRPNIFMETQIEINCTFFLIYNVMSIKRKTTMDLWACGLKAQLCTIYNLIITCNVHGSHLQIFLHQALTVYFVFKNRCSLRLLIFYVRRCITVYKGESISWHAAANIVLQHFSQYCANALLMMLNMKD